MVTKHSKHDVTFLHNEDNPLLVYRQEVDSGELLRVHVELDQLVVQTHFPVEAVICIRGITKLLGEFCWSAQP
jgi:hypothetical protein